MTVWGPPGSTYTLHYQFGPNSTGFYDTSTTLPGFLGPIGLQGATTLALSLLVDPTANPVGVIGASGRQDLNLVAPFQSALPITFEFQAVVTPPGGPNLVTNSQIRQIQIGVMVGVGPGTFTDDGDYRLPLSEGDAWDDIEQGDVDGDGDLDLLGVSQDASAGPGVVVLWPMLGGDYAAPITISDAGTPTSAEFADLDNDGFLDLVVSFIGTGDYVQVWLNGGLDATGTWLGFTAVDDARILKLGVPGGTNPTDIETADVDGDGDLDVFITSASDPLFGEQNRLFLNTTNDPANVFELLVDATPTNLPVIFDDSEDGEFFDFDGDGDQDLVIANVDGPAPITGVDYVMINQGGLQGGVPGEFQLPEVPPIPPVDDESSDVVIGDFDGNGFPDLYITNWRESTIDPFGNITWGAPLPDRLLLHDTIAGYIDASAALPEGDGSGTDAEVADFDLDGSDDIIVAEGSFRTDPIGATFGGFVLVNLGGMAAGFASIEIPDLDGMDIRDFEVGDWSQFLPALGVQGRWFDKEVGVAPLGAMTGAPVGLLRLRRN